MNLTEAMALAGAVLQGTLVLLLLVAWRALEARWLAWLASGALGIMVQYLLVAMGHYGTDTRWTAQPVAANAVCSLVAHGLITWALAQYVELAGAWRQRVKVIILGVVGTALAALAAGVLTRGVAIGLVGLAMCGWALLFALAMRREPRAGHGIVMFAVLVYPVSMIAAYAGWLSVVGAGLSLIVPHAVLCMTILTTGLVRAHQAAGRELQARQAAQDALERVNQTLELQVARRTAALRETIEGLENFNAHVSHDLRGPLGGIAGVARMAQEALAKGDLAQAERLLGAIARQSDTSTALVTSLLALAKAGDGPVERRPVRIADLVREVAESLALAAADARGGAVLVTVGDDLPEVMGNEALLRQVFANLMGNAAKFSRQAAVPRVEVGVARSGEGQALYVRDNGVGFTPEQATRLFQPFQRLHGGFEGHGIGLTIVKRIVERHGGRLWTESTPGQGATFWFTLGGTGEANERLAA